MLETYLQSGGQPHEVMLCFFVSARVFSNALTVLLHLLSLSVKKVKRKGWQCSVGENGWDASGQASRVMNEQRQVSGVKKKESGRRRASPGVFGPSSGHSAYLDLSRSCGSAQASVFTLAKPRCGTGSASDQLCATSWREFARVENPRATVWIGSGIPSHQQVFKILGTPLATPISVPPFATRLSRAPNPLAAHSVCG